MSYTSSTDLSRIRQWIMNKADLQTITQELAALGYDEHGIASSIKEFKKQKYAKQQFKGFIWLGIGGFLGFIACLLSMINPIPELYDLILYGLTSVAVVMLFMGLYYLLEG